MGLAGAAMPWHAFMDGGAVATTLKTRNVTVRGHRTSIRLEPAMWQAFDEIAAAEGRSIHELCGTVAGARDASTLTAAIRVFIVLYYRDLAAQAGLLPARQGSADRDRRGLAGRRSAGDAVPRQDVPALSRVG